MSDEGTPMKGCIVISKRIKDILFINAVHEVKFERRYIPCFWESESQSTALYCVIILCSRGVWMFGYGLGSKGIFLEKTLFYKLLHVVPEGPTVDGLMSLALVVEAVFLRPGERRIIMEWLIFDGVKDFVDH